MKVLKWLATLEVASLGFDPRDCLRATVTAPGEFSVTPRLS